MDVIESTSGKDDGHSSGFTTVAQLRPDTMDHNLQLKVAILLPTFAYIHVVATAWGTGAAFDCLSLVIPPDLQVFSQVVEVRPVHRGGAGGGRSSGTARLSECIVGDETGVVVFTASGADQGARHKEAAALMVLLLSLEAPFCCLLADRYTVIAVALAQVGQYLTLRNAKVDMFKGSMRISCGKWGSAVVADDLSFQPNVRPLLQSPELAHAHADPA